jgi:cytochrome c
MPAAACLVLAGALLILASCKNVTSGSGNDTAVSQTADKHKLTRAGAMQFVQCRACHVIDASGRHGVGPNLNGIVGAKAGTRAGYDYSPALMKSGLIWTPENLDAFLAKPNAVIPGTKMAYAGIASVKIRQELIAYLKSASGR